MTQYGALRMWATLLEVLAALGFVLAGAGTLIWAIEVDGAWETIGRLLLGGAVSISLPALSIAAARALQALADVGDTVAAR